MRAVLLAAPLLALLALASTGVTTPAACADPCVVQSSSAAYLPALVEVAAGSAVTWKSIDTTHISVDGLGVGDEDACFRASANVPTLVRFDIVGGVLHATQTSGAQSVTKPCATAEALPDGSFVVQYYCALHPQMRATLVVTPS